MRSTSFKHITRHDRDKIEALYNAGHAVMEIVKALGFSRTTIYRELSYGKYCHRNTDWTETIKYSADKAQRRADYYNTAKGAPLKLGNRFDWIDLVERLIIKEKMSPEVALGHIKTNNLSDFHVSIRTLYSYIDSGIFMNITNKDLLFKGNRKRKYRKVKQAKRLCRGKSIEDRSTEIEERSTFGHWEMDTVVGKRRKGEVLLVLTERKTRYEIVIKMPDKSAASTVRALNKLERDFGSAFSKVFKTITCDNGCEFADFEHIEKSCRRKGCRTLLFYCHPYSSYERGSNEKQNQMIRRIVKKGTPIENYTKMQIREVMQWINNYPRPMFGFKTSQQLFENELSKMGIKKFF
ncbi:MAG: IS30 family transposase [Clostridia bacterium]|nr:IS30 family transposase [Clostridia bacterium]